MYMSQIMINGLFIYYLMVKNAQMTVYGKSKYTNELCVCVCVTQVAELVKELRWELDQLLEDKIRNPSMDLCSCPRGSRIIHMIVHLISTQ